MANNARKGVRMSEKEIRKLDLRGEICLDKELIKKNY